MENKMNNVATPRKYRIFEQLDDFTSYLKDKNGLSEFNMGATKKNITAPREQLLTK